MSAKYYWELSLSDYDIALLKVARADFKTEITFGSTVALFKTKMARDQAVKYLESKR